MQYIPLMLAFSLLTPRPAYMCHRDRKAYRQGESVRIHSDRSRVSERDNCPFELLFRGNECGESAEQAASFGSGEWRETTTISLPGPVLELRGLTASCSATSMSGASHYGDCVG